jgi:hypothetical protein
MVIKVELLMNASGMLKYKIKSVFQFSLKVLFEIFFTPINI